VEVDLLAEGLDGRDHTRDEIFPGPGLEVGRQSVDGAAAELPKEPALELEEDPQHLGNSEDHLAVRHVEKERLSHPFPPLLESLGMEGGAEAPCPAGKHQQAVVPTARTADPGDSRARIAAVEIALYHLPYDGPKEAALLLESALILRQEALEMMKQQPGEDRAHRMERTIDSRHIWSEQSRNAPGTLLRRSES